MYKNVSIVLLYKKITSMITYFSAVAKYNLPHKELNAARTFCTGSYVHSIIPTQIFVRQYFCEFRQYLVYHENIGLENFGSPYVLYHSIRCFTWVEELPAITKWKSFLYCSIQFYIATANQEVSKLLPTSVTMA